MSNVRAQLGAERTKQVQMANAALKDYCEARACLRKFKGAMCVKGWPPHGTEGHLPPFSVAMYHPRDEAPLCRTEPDRQLFVVAVDHNGLEAGIVNPLCLPPAYPPTDFGRATTSSTSSRPRGRRRLRSAPIVHTWRCKRLTSSYTAPHKV